MEAQVERGIQSMQPTTTMLQQMFRILSVIGLKPHQDPPVPPPPPPPLS